MLVVRIVGAEVTQQRLFSNIEAIAVRRLRYLRAECGHRSQANCSATFAWERVMVYSGHHGKIVNSCETGAFRLIEIVYTSRSAISAHAHRSACFAFVFRGSCAEHYGNRQIEARRSSLVYRPAGEIHSDEICAPNTRCLLIEFDPLWLKALPLVPAGPALYESESLFWIARRLQKELQVADDVTSIAVEGLMLEIAAGVWRAASPRSPVPEWLRKAREIVDARFTERVSLSTVA